MSARAFHGIMSALMLIAYYASGGVLLLGIASIFWACLYLLDVSLAIRAMIEIDKKTEGKD